MELSEDPLEPELEWETKAEAAKGHEHVSLDPGSVRGTLQTHESRVQVLAVGVQLGQVRVLKSGILTFAWTG